MNKKITLDIDLPILDTDEELVSTIFRLNENSDMSGDHIDEHENTDDMMTYIYTHNFRKYVPIYAEIIHKIKLSDDSIVEISNGIDEIYGDSKILTTRNMVYGPKIDMSVSSNVTNSDMRLFSFNINEPIFYRGSSVWTGVVITVMDTFENTVNTIKLGPVTSVAIDMTKYEGLNFVYLSVEYVFSTPVYQPESRVYVPINNNRMAKFSLARTNLYRGRANSILVKYYYSMITKVKFVVINKESNEVIFSNIESTTSINIPSRFTDPYEEVLLMVYIDTKDFGTMYKEFDLKVGN